MAQIRPSIDQLRQQYHNRLAELYPDREIRAIFDLLMHHYTGWQSHEISLKRKESLETKVFQAMERALERLDDGEPVQHITGLAAFCGLQIGVGPEVFIPRPETEELVHWVLEDLADGIPVRDKLSDRDVAAGRDKIPAQDNKSEPGGTSARELLRILDIGTGSGCIALALKHHHPDAEVSGLDRSAPAIQQARRNADALQLDVKFHEYDILKAKSPVIPEKDQGTYRVIISNPPYVPESEKFYLPLNVRGSDPEIALFVPDEDPLIFYRHIVNFAMQQLEPKGGVYFEIHESFGKEVANLLAYNGFENVQLRKDINGKDRMIRGLAKS